MPDKKFNIRYTMKVIAVNIIILSPLIIGEFAARIDMKMRNDEFRERNIKYTYMPYISYAYNQFDIARQNLSTDRHGFIHNGHDKDRDLRIKGENQFRIVMLGGSSTAGTYVNGPEDTLASRLERRLTKEFQEKNINLVPQVINAGVSSYFSAQELMLLNFVLPSIKPDYVMMFDGANDCNSRYNQGETPLDETIVGMMNGNYHAYTQQFMNSYNNIFSYSGLFRQFLSILSGKSALVTWFLEGHYSRFVNKYEKEKKRVQNIINDGNFSNPNIEYKIDFSINRLNYGNNIRSAAAIASSRQIGFTAIVQPSLMLDLPMSPAEAAMVEPGLESKSTCFQGLVDELDTVRIENRGNDRLRFIDMRKIFNNKDKDTTVFGDSVHYTNTGRAIIIDQMMASFGDHILSTAKAVAINRK